MIFIKSIAPILLFLLLISFSAGCGTSTVGQRADSLFLVTNNVSIDYSLKNPAEKYYLPYVLEEISGLTFKSPHSLLAIDDESGRVFEYNLVKKEITHSIEFYKSDDYEGVELVSGQVYVLKNDGDVFEFPYSSNKQLIAKKYETELNAKNDTEGLGYDQSTNQLLIACKEDGGIGKDKIAGRAFYSFDLNTKKLNPSPAFIIGTKELEAFWESEKQTDYDKARIKFKPSAIATHPISGDHYILSSVGKMLIVTSKNGKIKATYPISPRVLGQPEGICFAPNGDLYISSEGEGDRGYILKFEMNKRSAP